MDYFLFEKITVSIYTLLRHNYTARYNSGAKQPQDKAIGLWCRYSPIQLKDFTKDNLGEGDQTNLVCLHVKHSQGVALG